MPDVSGSFSSDIVRIEDGRASVLEKLINVRDMYRAVLQGFADDRENDLLIIKPWHVNWVENAALNEVKHPFLGSAGMSSFSSAMTRLRC